MANDDERDALDELVALNLLDYDEATQRLSWHDLLHEFVQAHTPEEMRKMTLLRHARHYTGIAKEADALYQLGHDNVQRGLALFDRERANIEVAFATLAQPNLSAELQHALINLVDAVVPYTGYLRFHPRQSIAWLQVEVEVAHTAKDKIAEGKALGNLGVTHKNLGEYQEAILFHERALQILREIGNPHKEGLTLGNLGNAYNHLGDYRRAIECTEQGLQILREIGDRRGESAAIGSLGNIYRSLGDYRQAIGFFEQSLQLSRETGDLRTEGINLGNLGNAYHNLGDMQKSIAYSEHALLIAREIGNQREEGRALGNLGGAFHILGDTQKAIDYLLQSLLVRHAIGDSNGEGAVCCNLSEAYATVGDLNRALAYAERALATFTQIESPDVQLAQQQIDDLRQRLAGSV